VITILTPTYNRAHTLARVFESLERQGRRDFEWLVVDDGSTDGTAALVAGFGARADFPVRYLAKENGGRHTALNLGFAEAAGEHLIVMDSDDWLADDALESFVRAWESIPAAEREGFAAVAGLCAAPSGALIGTEYPADPLDSDFVEIRAVHGVKGDKKEMFRTEVVRALPFPVFPGEKRVPFSHMLVRLSRRGRVRFFNRVVTVKEYRADGLTASVDRIRMRSPLGSRAGYLQWLAARTPVPAAFRLRHYANFVRYSLHARVGVGQRLREVGSVPFWLGAMPAGVALFCRDRLRFRGATPAAAVPEAPAAAAQRTSHSAPSGEASS
jgi:glycosyltransferase involved in cell wall biosynthesis